MWQITALNYIWTMGFQGSAIEPMMSASAPLGHIVISPNKQYLELISCFEHIKYIIPFVRYHYTRLPGRTLSPAFMAPVHVGTNATAGMNAVSKAFATWGLITWPASF